MLSKVLRTPATSVVLFALAAVLLLGGGIGAAQSAPRVESNDWGGQVELVDINTSIIENGTEADGVLLADLLERSGDETFKVGKKYDEELAVRNSGDIDEFVRVTVRAYWTDGDGKEVQLDPSLVSLEFDESNGWSIDAAASGTAERTVLYYDKAIAPGDDTSAFLKSFTIDGKVAKAAKKVKGGYVYVYDGLQFQIEAKADAVQTHNGDEAMTSAWGRTN